MLLLVYVAVALRQVSGRGPEIWILFGGGAVATLLVGLLGIDGALRAVASVLPILIFLFALFVFTVDLDRAGALAHLARWLCAKARRPEDLPLVLFVGFGILSAFVVNDALVILGVPLLFALARELDLDPLPLLLILAFSVTVGSVPLPIGNPQNLLVSVASGLADPVATFLRYLLLPTAINLALGGLFLRWVHREAFRAAAERHRGLRARARPLFPSGGWARRVTAHPSLVVFPATMGVLLGASILPELLAFPVVPIYVPVLAGALVVLALSPIRGPLLRRVDWSVLLLFVGLFVVVAGAVESGVVASLERAFPIPGPSGGFGGPLAIALSSIGGTQLVSNVPWVALQIPLMHGLGYGAGTPVAWITLASASTLAGNVTLLGAASNLIIAEQAERLGVRVRLVRFAREGIPLAAITLSVLLACLALGL